MNDQKLDEARKRAETTYNAASDYFDHPANTFWTRYGRRTVERLQLSSGDHVLDVCCGSGASAIPAAQIVSPNGSVVGVDLAENLLTLARTKAQELGLNNVDFKSGDMTNLAFADDTFDAVVCVFGIFFVPDMEAALRELKRVVRPGGKLAITTWGPRLFEPANGAFWTTVRSLKPDLYKDFNPWDRISDVEGLRALLLGGGLNEFEIVAEAGSQELNVPEDWWAIVMGSGYRGTVEQLAPAELEELRRENLDYIRRSSISAIESNVVYAIATKT